MRDLASGAETRIEDVTAYAFSDSARWLAYTTASRTEAHNGAHVRALGSQGVGAEVALATGRGSYRGLTFDRAGRQVLFVSDRDEATTAKPRPAAPARAASMVAFKASRFVWPAIDEIKPTTSPTRAAAVLSSCTSTAV